MQNYCGGINQTKKQKIMGLFIGMGTGRRGMTKTNTSYLEQFAFSIDVNEAADTPLNVNVGGNRNVFDRWKAQWKSGVMDAGGNWAELSKADNRYFADGTLAVNLRQENLWQG